MPENLVACETEDSMNCVWNAQEQGNGIRESFVDIDGTAFCAENVSEAVVIECEEGKVPGWLDENGNPQGCVDNNPTPLEPKNGFFVDCGTQTLHYWYEGEDGEDVVADGTPASSSELYNYGCTDEEGNSLWPLPVEELPEVDEVIIETPVIVDHVPEEFASTGTGDVVAGLLIGLAILAAGVVLFIKGRKNK